MSINQYFAIQKSSKHCPEGTQSEFESIAWCPTL